MPGVVNNPLTDDMNTTRPLACPAPKTTATHQASATHPPRAWGGEPSNTSQTLPLPPSARVFREETGFSLHGYRTQLRLRLALDALAAGREIGELAHDLGFASHSHFTDSFRRVFGVAPSRMG